MSEKYISIGDAAAATRLSTRTIRHYEAIGLINAEKRGKARYFSGEIVQELTLIDGLRKLNFSLAEIGVLLNKKLVAAADFKPDVIEFKSEDFLNRLEEIKRHISQVEAQLCSKIK